MKPLLKSATPRVAACVAAEGLDPVRLLQELIRIPSENPPGDVRECIGFIGELLGKLGIACACYAHDPRRPNLVARLPGRGAAPPLLLYGHVDVVPVLGQSWSVPPFSGLVRDGFVWGRGALDMKGGLAMLLAAFAALKDAPAPGDVILCIVSDEETGGQHGAGFLVENHAGLFAGVRHALGEFGGFSFDLFGRRFMPIQVSERQFVGITAHFSAAGGHAALSGTANAAVSAARFVLEASRIGFPVVHTETTRSMLDAMASSIPLVAASALRLLSVSAVAPLVLRVIGQRAAALASCLRSAVTPTVIHCGSKRNVVPSSAQVEIDARLVPGDSLERLLARLKAAAPEGTAFAVHAQPPHRGAVDMSQYRRLADLLRGEYPDAVPVPMLLPGTTDARHFNRLDIQTYGFLPLAMPKGMSYLSLIHGSDERIPVAALSSGARLIEKYVRSYEG